MQLCSNWLAIIWLDLGKCHFFADSIEIEFAMIILIEIMQKACPNESKRKYTEAAAIFKGKRWHVYTASKTQGARNLYFQYVNT